MCVFRGERISCTKGDAYWVNPPKECYVSPTPEDVAPKPPEPPWPKGETKGAIYDCDAPEIANPMDHRFWALNPPPPAGG